LNNIYTFSYPTEPGQDFYLVIKIEKLSLEEFYNIKWRFKELPGYKTGNQSASPFSVTLTDLMNKKEM
jgi:hypothetical protein